MPSPREASSEEGLSGSCAERTTWVEASSGTRTGVHKAVSLKKAPGTAPAGRRETIALRRLLRELRTATAGTKSSTAELLSGDVPSVFRQEAALRVVRSALFRLPERQRELIRRHDLEGEPADALQHSLGLSARQYYRDRRAGLAALSRYLLGTAAWPGDRTVPAAFSANRRHDRRRSAQASRSCRIRTASSFVKRMRAVCSSRATSRASTCWPIWHER